MAMRRKTPSTEAVQSMLFPVRHTGCGKIHDAGDGVTVVDRYSDCTRWKCPNCAGICDDRSLDWGGNVVRIDKSTYGLPYGMGPDGLVYFSDMR